MSEIPLQAEARPPPRPGFLETVQNSKFLRVLLLGFLSLLLLIPVGSIRDLIAERERTRGQAQLEIARQWGGAQTITGLFLVLPYRNPYVVTRDGKTVTEYETGFGVVLPELLDIAATETTEHRQRGLFSIPVYRGKATLAGHFSKPSLAAIGIPDEAIIWDKVEVVLMMDDLRALTGPVELSIGDTQLRFQPGGGQVLSALPLPRAFNDEGQMQERAGGIVHAAWPLSGAEQALTFNLPLSFNGSERLDFMPTGRLTRVRVQGDWPSPSFSGAWLPTERSVAEDGSGFTARWEITDLSRDFGQVWNANRMPTQGLRTSSFGLSLFPAVDEYMMAHRAVKYAQLFIVLTFALWWLFEIVGGVRLHPLQYLLVGAGLSAFYLLQLALAEHLGFRLSYALAATAVTVQITLYSWSALHSLRRASGIGLAMAGLYTYLFAVLREENYALLTGAVGLFLMLSLIMWLTRRIDWGSEARR